MRDIACSGRAVTSRHGSKLVAALLIVGGALLAVAMGARLASSLESSAGLERFARARRGPTTSPSPAAGWPGIEPDRSAWSAARAAAWQEGAEQDLGMPLGVLRISRLGLEAPIWVGIDERTLNRGLGLIPGTAPVDGSGNVGIAGHRDSFFRVLAGIRKGDEIQLETLADTRRFVVTDTWIVDPESVWVLDPTPRASLTLVTCYPFYFVGNAPQRFVVRAQAAAQWR